MRIFSLFWLEFRRLLRSPLTWLIMGLTVLSPVMGLFLYQPTEATTLGTYLANPSLAAGIFSSLLFAFLTVWEWNRVKRGQMEALLYSIVSPLTVSCIRLLSLIGTAGLAWSITVVVWMPFTMMASGSVFDSLTYFLCYFLFMGMAIPIAAAGRSGGGVCLPVHPPGGPVPCGICRVLRAEPDCMGGELAAVLAQPLRMGNLR